jgi:hypothetical protein
MRFILLALFSFSALAIPRPNDVVKFRSDFCICQDGVSLGTGDCGAFCVNNKNTNGLEILYAGASFTPTKDFKNVEQWCTKKKFFETKRPYCVLEVKYQDGTTTEVEAVAQINEVRANISTIQYDQIFIATLKEATTQGRSDSLQATKKENMEGLPLQISYYNDFNLWDSKNRLFRDLDANGALDIHDVIRKKAKHFGLDLPMATKLLSPMAVYPELGWSLKPFVDSVTNVSYCPASTHYNSSVPLFKTLSKVLQVETEGIYILTPTDSLKEVLPIKESDLKMVWFYLKGDRPQLPNDFTVVNNTIFVHVPIDKIDPYIKKPNQKVYQLRSIEELGGMNWFATHDKKIGCIPK